MNLFTPTQALPSGTEAFETLLENKIIKIERICSNSVKKGEWYDQYQDEWITLLQGKAILEFDDDKKKLVAGETLLIAKHQRHRVLETSENAIWLAIHF